MNWPAAAMSLPAVTTDVPGCRLKQLVVRAALDVVRQLEATRAARGQA